MEDDVFKVVRLSLWCEGGYYQFLIDYCHFVIDIPLGFEETPCTKIQRDRGFMPYERARQIEMRFQEALRLIAKEPHNAPQLAAALKVSTATVQRLIGELRRRGYSIRSVHDAGGWRYELLDHHPPQTEEVRT